MLRNVNGELNDDVYITLTQLFVIFYWSAFVLIQFNTDAILILFNRLIAVQISLLLGVTVG